MDVKMMVIPIALAVSVLGTNFNSGDITVTLQKEVNAPTMTVQQNDIKKEKNKVTEEIKLPSNTDNSFKTYMDYRTITDTSSKQYQLCHKKAVTADNGIRKIDGYYCVAMGSGICDRLGAKFKITLSTGKTFKVVLAEQKADIHTDDTNKYVLRDDGSINILEFVVDADVLPTIVKVMGNISYMPGDHFKGRIVKIEEVD